MPTLFAVSSTPARAAAAVRAAVAPALCGLAYAAGAAHGPWPLAAALALGLLLWAPVALRGRAATVAFAAAGAAMLVFGLPAVPGFSRLEVGDTSVNVAKAIAGLAAAAMLPSAWRWNARCTAIGLACLATVPLLAWAVGYVRWAPAALQAIALFAFANLFSTIAEEWFFRRWVQQPLQRYGTAVAVMGTAALFGLAHAAGGPVFMMLAGVAGLAYAAVFHASGGSIWAAVALHLALNVTRIGLFGG